MRSSLGFHTMTLSMVLLKQETSQLFQDFQRYHSDTDSIQMYPDGNQNCIIKFRPNTRGIEWKIRQNIWSNSVNQFVNMIDVTINPKILGGVTDYITAATFNDMERAILQFDAISKAISPILRMFHQYKVKRIDYCVNLYLPELLDRWSIQCSDIQIMKLIKRSDIPPAYREWMKYDEKAHRMKSEDSSFYLTCKSARVNCYSKFMQQLQQSDDNVKKGYQPIPEVRLESARRIIRFEVQCDYQKIYDLSQRVTGSRNYYLNKCKFLLTSEICRDIVNAFWFKTIGKGHWYTLKGAISIIKSQKFLKQKENRLIEALQWVNHCRSIPKAKEAFPGDLDTFRRTLKELSTLGVNPVTIPKEWGVGRIWNLLETYHNKVAEENWCSLSHVY